MTRVNEALLQFIFIFLVALLLATGAIRLYPGMRGLISGILVRFPAFAAATKNNTLSPLSEIPISPPAILVPKQAPTRIALPSIDTALGISEATISENNWTLYDDKASWLTTSAEPGKGNVILYAHNKKGLFGNLGELQIGAPILVEHIGQEFQYSVIEKRSVSPRDVDAVLADDNRLTLYTCDGTFDQKRLVVVAVPRI